MNTTMVVIRMVVYNSKRLSAVVNQELNVFRPVQIYCIAALPRNEMGKVLRQAVRAKTIANAVQPPFARMD